MEVKNTCNRRKNAEEYILGGGGGRDNMRFFLIECWVDFSQSNSPSEEYLQ